MTTEAAAAQYLAKHLAAVAGRDYAVYNPHGKQHDELPWIIGFNNGGEHGWLRACLIAQDGTPLGEHICSHEGYMPSDLGVIEDTSPDRHKDFRAHYPDGYRMDFVGYDYIKYDPRLIEAFRLHAVQRGKAGEKEIVAAEHTPGLLHAEHDDEALATYPREERDVGAHTSGTWRVSREHNGTFVRAAHGGLVASMEAGSQAMRDQDALLISVTPEMFEACKMFVDACENAPSKIAAAVRAARAAIARVEGK